MKSPVKNFLLRYYNAILPLWLLLLILIGFIALGREEARAQVPPASDGAGQTSPDDTGRATSSGAAQKICQAGDAICDKKFQSSNENSMGGDPCGGKYCIRLHGYKTRVEAAKIMFDKATSGAWTYPHVCGGTPRVGAGGAGADGSAAWNLWLADDDCRITNDENSQKINASGISFYGEAYAWRCQFLANDCYGSMMSAYILAIQKSCVESLNQNPCKDFMIYLQKLNPGLKYPNYSYKNGTPTLSNDDTFSSTTLYKLPRNSGEAIDMYGYVRSHYMNGGPAGGNCFGSEPLGSALSSKAMSGSVMGFAAGKHWGMILGQDACGDTFQIESNWSSVFSCYSKATGLSTGGRCNQTAKAGNAIIGYGDGGVGINHPSASPFFNNGSAWMGQPCFGGAPIYAGGATDPIVEEFVIPGGSCGTGSPTEKLVKGNIKSATCDVYHPVKDSVIIKSPTFLPTSTTTGRSGDNIPSCGWPIFQLSNTIGSRDNIGGVKPAENATHGFNSDAYRRKKTDVVNPAAVFSSSKSNGYSNTLYNSFCYWIPRLASRAVDTPNAGFAPMYNFAVTPPVQIGNLTYNESMAALKRQRDTCIYGANSFTNSAGSVPACNPGELLGNGKSCGGSTGAFNPSKCEEEYLAGKKKYDAKAIEIFKANLAQFGRYHVDNPKIASWDSSCNSKTDVGDFIKCYEQTKGCDALVDYGSDVMDDYIDLGCNDAKEKDAPDGTKTLDLSVLETAENMVNFLMCKGYNLVTDANLNCPCDYNKDKGCPFPKLLPGLKSNLVSRNTKACVDATIRKQRSVEPSSVAFRNTMLVGLENGTLTPEDYAKKYCQPLDEEYIQQYKSKLPPNMGYCPSTIGEMQKAYEKNDPNLADYNSYKDVTTKKYSPPYVERILEPEPSALSIHSHRYYLRQEEKDQYKYPERSPLRMNEIGSLCRPYINPNDGGTEPAETRWNEAKGKIDKEFDVGNFHPSFMYPQTDHSDGFSPRHQEAKYELDHPQYSDVWHKLNPKDFVQTWYPQCFMCNTSHSGYRRKNIITPMQWNHRNYKTCVDCLRYCVQKAVKKIGVRSCTTQPGSIDSNGNIEFCDPNDTAIKNSGGGITRCIAAGCKENSWECKKEIKIEPPLHFGGSRRGDQTLLGGCCDGKQDTKDGLYMCSESRVDELGNAPVIGSSVCPAGKKSSEITFPVTYDVTSSNGGKSSITKYIKYIPETERMLSPDKNSFCGCPPGSNDNVGPLDEYCGEDNAIQTGVMVLDDAVFCDEKCHASKASECCNELDLEYYPDNMLKIRTSDMVWGDDMGSGDKKGDKELQHMSSAKQRIGFKSYIGEGHTVDYTKEFRPPHGGPYIRTSTHNNRNYPVPEGFWFMEEFSDTHHDNTYDKIMGKVPPNSNDLTEMCVDQGDQFPLYRQFKMPYAKWLDSPGLSKGVDNLRGSLLDTRRQDRGEPRVSCKGYQDTIVGVGNERDNCGYGGWEELKLYQHRCFRYFGISCICDYDKTFKIGSAEDYVLRKAGGVPVFTVTKPSQNNTVKTESSVPVPQPASWRGYVSEPDPENRFPAYDLAKSYGYTSSNVDVLKTLVKDKIIEVGLSKARVGDILIWDRDVLWTSDDNDCMKNSETLNCQADEIDLIIKARSDALNVSGTHKTIPLKNSRLPHVAYVINAKTKSSVAHSKTNAESIHKASKCGSGKESLSGCVTHDETLDAINTEEKDVADGNEFVEIAEMNNGKNPDICGNTDRWGREGVRTLFKSRPATATPEDLMSAGGDCAEPSLRQCTESLWDKVKVYHIQLEMDNRRSLQQMPAVP